jgi:hypothetical protein
MEKKIEQGHLILSMETLTGKTIKEAVLSNEYLIISLSDGSFCCFRAELREWGLEIYRLNLLPIETVGMDALEEAGVYSKEEAEDYRLQKEKEREERNREYRRKEYEKLKKEFGE